MGSDSHDPEYAQDLYRDLCNNLMELAVNYGLFMTIIHHWPDSVRENFTERMQKIVLRCQQEIQEVQQFAEAFDE